MTEWPAFFLGLALGLALAAWHFRARVAAARAQAAAPLELELARMQERLRADELRAAEREQQAAAAEQQLKERFQALASEILEEKSRRFANQNQENLRQLLDPVRSRLVEFQGTVQDVAAREGKERAALGEQVRQLLALNQQLAAEARNLTTALKGESKTRGSWGEIILTRALEAAGLRPGHEFDVQPSLQAPGGGRLQPDVIVRLPGNRHLVIDAKVSLVAYEAHANAATDEDRRAALARHMDSVRSHLRDLSSKNYQDLPGLQSPDFVVMFLPVEPAFHLAASHDDSLWQDAWKKNILLAGPSTLLFVLRVVAQLWRQENQNQNALEIARRGAALHDKLAAFVDDIDDVLKRLDQATDAGRRARAKLSTGPGNLLRQAGQMRELGIKATRNLPSADDDDTTPPDDHPPHA